MTIFVTANIFQPLIDVFESVLKFFHNSLGVPWGWAIVLLTLVIRALLIPLTLKQFHSMQRMQQHMPELKAIQNKYKDDKQRQQQEMMKFYKENKINPLGSCLPLVLQLPVFVSLYYMLRQSLRGDICPQKQPGAYLVDGHWVLPYGTSHTVPCGPHGGASFLFIQDLTNHAAGVVLVVLILLYVGTQLASSLMMSTAAMDKTQRQIMLVMPLFFVIFLINFPAGVILYWITTNIWTIGQQYIIRKRIGPVTARPGPAGSDGEGADGPDRGGGRPDRGAPNGVGAGGLGGLLRGKPKPAKEPAAVGAGTRSRAAGPPPPPPRKKKKRSGRRR